MMYGEMTAQQQYFHDVAWTELKSANQCMLVNRKARAQYHIREAMFYLAKVPAEFIEPELQQNINKIDQLITRGY